MCHIALVEIERHQNSGAIVEFLTPLCKIYASQAGIRAADLGIQILGGYGDLEEYGLSQVWRDGRISLIYERSDGIHAVTLATRGIRLQDGAAITPFRGLIDRLAPGDQTLARRPRLGNIRRVSLRHARTSASRRMDAPWQPHPCRAPQSAQGRFPPLISAACRHASVCSPSRPRGGISDAAELVACLDARRRGLPGGGPADVGASG